MSSKALRKQAAFARIMSDAYYLKQFSREETEENKVKLAEEWNEMGDAYAAVATALSWSTDEQ
jgi:hypothetical protein